MGVLGKDLFDIYRPRTHTKVWFGEGGYWLEDNPWVQYPYGTILTELLDYDAEKYHRRAAALRTAIESGNRTAAAQRFRAVVHAFIHLPLYHRILHRWNESQFEPLLQERLSDEELGKQILSGNSSVRKYLWADDDLRQIEEVYKPFLLNLFKGTKPEKKKGQRKLPLAMQLVNHGKRQI